MHLESLIKAEAFRLGFKLSGICLPDIPLHFDSYLDWLEMGCQASMVYLSRADDVQKRKNPCELLPGCQSILCLALPYLPTPAKTKLITDRSTGRIASYALVEDYHTVIQSKLNQLIAFIRQVTNVSFNAKACVDTSPILEKDFAQQAGLGYIGKNSLLVTPHFGSYIFLSEILLTLPLEADQAYEIDPCENCQRCIQACPTQAIRPDRSIDARRCLSYLTIEHRGSIPIEFRHKISDRIFGCDTCQSVCPINQNTPRLENCSLLQLKVEPIQDLICELSLTEDQFKEKFKGTPVLRTKRQGYLRNVVIAIGNQPNPIAVPLFNFLLNSEPDPVIHDAVAWALDQIKSMA